MRQASTPERQYFIKQKLKSPNLKAVLALEYEDGGVWTEILDLDGENGVAWTKTMRRDIYSRFALTPLASAISFKVINPNGKYSDGSGIADDIFVPDRRIRLRAGYVVGLDLLTSEPVIEWIYKNVFYLDTPKFPEPSAPEIPVVECSGRDIYKRAIENEVNLKDLTAGVPLHEIIKDVCDQIGLPYTATSIDDLTAFGNRTLPDGLGDSKKADDIFGLILQILNKEDPLLRKYRMYVEYDEMADDSVLFVKPRAENYSSIFAFNYRYYTSLGSRSRDYDKLLSRLTVSNKDFSVKAEQELASLTITSPGTYTLSWTGEAVFTRIKKNVLAAGFALAITNMGSTFIQVEATGSGSLELKVFGSKWNGGSPLAQGEFIHLGNMFLGKGQTFKAVNPLVKNDAEALAIAKGFISEYGSPSKIATDLEYPYLNLIPDINDMVLLISRFLYEDNLYRVASIQHTWNIHTDFSIFALEDSGLNFSDVFGGHYDAPGLKYDMGFIYDWRFGALATDEEISSGSHRVKEIETAPV